MPRIDKVAVLDALRERVQETLDALIASQKTVQAGAIHEENRQEDPKDNASNRSQLPGPRFSPNGPSPYAKPGLVLATLRLKIFADDGPASTTALVGLSDSAGAVEVYFLVPFGGGEGLTVDDISIQTVTPARRAVRSSTVGAACR